MNADYLPQLPPHTRLDFKMKYDDSSVKCRYVVGTIRRGLVENFSVYQSHPVSAFLYEMTKKNFLDKLQYTHNIEDLPEDATFELILKVGDEEVSCLIPLEQVERAPTENDRAFIIDTALDSLQKIMINTLMEYV